MTEAEKYQGYSWIKVKRSKPVAVEGVLHVSEAHHIEETTFLIDEIRKLAARVDELTIKLSQQQLQSYVQAQDAARRDYDDLPYAEEDR